MSPSTLTFSYLADEGYFDNNRHIGISTTVSRLSALAEDGRLLVYRLHFLCQPGSDHRQEPNRHVQWNLASGHASLYCGPVGRGGDRNCSDRLAAAL